ncbi:hypothetical protein R3P38DRAFT_3182660 [Favolaschia claudopus]|uniref:Uncharacterized protein n=1 Tax=Favolaschia claudopus TaxID=2862362 RepID=A0AAW0CGH8_9AGAR
MYHPYSSAASSLYGTESESSTSTNTGSATQTPTKHTYHPDASPRLSLTPPPPRYSETWSTDGASIRKHEYRDDFRRYADPPSPHTARLRTARSSIAKPLPPIPIPISIPIPAPPATPPPLPPMSPLTPLSPLRRPKHPAVHTEPVSGWLDDDNENENADSETAHEEPDQIETQISDSADTLTPSNSSSTRARNSVSTPQLRYKSTIIRFEGQDDRGVGHGKSQRPPETAPYEERPGERALAARKHDQWRKKIMDILLI